MFTITRTHLGTKYTTMTSESDRTTAKWIISTLDYLLKFNETLTGPELADRLEQHADPTNPKTAYALRWLRGPNEPYPFGTHILIKPHNRHELPDALVYGHCTATDGYRYKAIFPFAGGLRFANVYSDEIADVLGQDEIETARLLEVGG